MVSCLDSREPDDEQRVKMIADFISVLRLKVYSRLFDRDVVNEMERIQKAEEIREETPPKEEVTQKIFKVI